MNKKLSEVLGIFFSRFSCVYFLCKIHLKELFFVHFVSMHCHYSTWKLYIFASIDSTAVLFSSMCEQVYSYYIFIHCALVFFCLDPKAEIKLQHELLLVCFSHDILFFFNVWFCQKTYVFVHYFNRIFWRVNWIHFQVASSDAAILVNFAINIILDFLWVIN